MATISEMDEFFDFDGAATKSEAKNLPKAGARFTRHSVRVLKGWLSSHSHHPYPTEPQKENLERQTGLSKTQITNWLANARRRRKVHTPRSTSPGFHSPSNPVDIPRRDTPALENMNPLERWQNSPPENEPASVAAIANAIISSKLLLGHESASSYVYTNSSSEAACSSISNLKTSQSSGDSFASAFSHGSRGSFGSFGNRERRRRCRPSAKPIPVFVSGPPQKTFQCTFCTETFNRKHSWQRHEKSLHLSLDRWVCAPNGPTYLCQKSNLVSCVFCGLANPDESHINTHNHTSCAKRPLEERTFYRKDHIRQHLNLVHKSKYQNFLMDGWKIEMPVIRSRCGFCDAVMYSWLRRTDHLAEHFKAGKTMADWKGDWGFEPEILEIVENGMPPYLIEFERNTLLPFKAVKERPESQRTSYDLVKMGLVDFVNDRISNGVPFSDMDLLLEAGQIFSKLDNAAEGMQYRGTSWFRDLFLEGTQAANQTKTSGTNLETFQLEETSDSGYDCPNEMMLKQFVHSQKALGSIPTNFELQIEASRILAELEPTSSFPCDAAVSWFNHLIMSSTDWLKEFRQRENLPTFSETDTQNIPFADCSIDPTTYDNLHILNEQIDLAQPCSSTKNLQPSDSDLELQDRNFILGNNEVGDLTSVDKSEWFKNPKYQDDGLLQHERRDPADLAKTYMPFERTPSPSSTLGHSVPTPNEHPKDLHWEIMDTFMPSKRDGSSISHLNSCESTPFARRTLFIYPQLLLSAQNQPTTYNSPKAPVRYYFSDPNCYRRLTQELSRFIKSCLSHNNPAQHVPTDEEIQNQARWIIFDEDDPWNQTPADNPLWLLHFKRDIGLIDPD